MQSLSRCLRPVLFTCLSFLGVASLSAADRPNILLIYADDVGYGDLGCYGAKAVDTPNLDRLAENGRRFTAAYASASTCTPSRYSLLTGEWAFRNKSAQILPGNAPLIIDADKASLASMLRSVGYRTGLVGKWHLGLGESDTPLDWNGDIAPGPRELGFDYSYHMAATGDRVPTVYIENGKVDGLDASDPISVSYEGEIGEDPTGLSHPELLKVQADEQHAKTIVDGTSRIGYMSGGQSARWTDEEMPDHFLKKAIQFIEAESSEPFFLYYATHENHVPRLPHPRFKGSSSLGVRGDAVVQMDWGIGEMLESLESTGKLDDTLIIFTSDNGPVLFDGYFDGARENNGDHRAAGPWKGGKYSVWEGGTRMPFIAHWPKRIQPSVTDSVLSQVDLLASFASLTGAKVPSGSAIDSENHIDLLLGNSELGRDFLVQQGSGAFALRQGSWKYIAPGKVRNRTSWGKVRLDEIEEPGALFFLPEDPEELNNVADMYPKIANKMKRLLDMELSDQ